MKNIKEKNSNYENSKALYVLKIITMSFAILACVIVATAMLTRWIMDLNQKIKASNTKVAKAAARINKFRKARIKHILKQRKLQLKEEKKGRKWKNHVRDKHTIDLSDIDDIDDIDEDEDFTDELFEEITGDDHALNDFDNELSDVLESLNDEDE